MYVLLCRFRIATILTLAMVKSCYSSQFDPVTLHMSPCQEARPTFTCHTLGNSLNWNVNGTELSYNQLSSVGDIRQMHGAEAILVGKYTYQGQELYASILISFPQGMLTIQCSSTHFGR